MKPKDFMIKCGKCFNTNGHIETYVKSVIGIVTKLVCFDCEHEELLYEK